MKFIRKSGLWERDDLDLWVVVILGAVICFLFRFTHIFISVTQRCVSFDDVWLQSSPSLYLVYFAIFEGLFIWNFVIFLDGAWQRKLPKSYLVIHIVFAVLVGSMLYSLFYQYRFINEYESIMKYADADWNAVNYPNPGYLTDSLESCRASKRFVGRWEVANIEKSGEGIEFNFVEIRLKPDLQFELYGKDLELVHYGRWDPSNISSGDLILDYFSIDYMQKFDVSDSRKQTMNLKKVFSYLDHEEKGQLSFQLKKLPPVDEPRYILDFDWSFIYNREKYGDK